MKTGNFDWWSTKLAIATMVIITLVSIYVMIKFY